MLYEVITQDRAVDRWRMDFGTYLLQRYGAALVAGRRQEMDIALDQARRAGIDPSVFPLATEQDNGVFLPTRAGRDAIAGPR